MSWCGGSSSRRSGRELLRVRGIHLRELAELPGQAVEAILDLGEALVDRRTMVFDGARARSLGQLGRVMAISVAALDPGCWAPARGRRCVPRLGRTAVGVVGGGLAAGWMVVILIAGRMLTLVVIGISAAARPHVRVPTGVLVVVVARRGVERCRLGSTPSSKAESRMTLSSHSPTDMPERRAASRAVSRACRLTPSTCHGTPDFMPASACWTGRSGSRTAAGAPGAR